MALWETEWGQGHFREIPAASIPARWFGQTESIAQVYLAFWSEHCLECAYPTCYKTCPLFQARPDGNCARFAYGIRHGQIPGRRGLAYDLQFKRWGKLETQLNTGSFGASAASHFRRIDRMLLCLVNPAARFLGLFASDRFLNRKYNRAREIALQLLSDRNAPEFDEFVLEAINPSEDAFRLMIEASQGKKLFRTAVTMASGYNLHRIPCRQMGLNLSCRDGRVDLYPENDREARLVFTFLDFVKYARTAISEQPAPRVKCLVWDLDNTLWDGVLVENGPEGIRLKTEVLQTIRALDERGILHSIASKNDHAHAWEALGKFGLQEYFLYPAIHWGPKSESLNRIAEALNIHLNTFAFVDDSEIERSEVATRHPCVRTYDAARAGELSRLPEFEGAITAESKRRRLSYLTETRRQQEARIFTGNPDEFLRHCELQIEIFPPRTDSEIDRCLELLQRTNQLNLSTRRYAREEFCSLLRKREVLALAIRARDKFGDYGVIGVATLVLQEEASLLDFVLSCRVAKKRVENAWFAWLLQNLQRWGYLNLAATFQPTDRNAALLEGLEQIGFARTAQESRQIQLSRSCLEPVPFADVVTVRQRDLGLVSGPGPLTAAKL
jgi:FkbH-like protein